MGPLLCAMALTAACTSSTAPSGPPNIVVVLGDDHGYPYSGFMGNRVVQTPNLDRLAEGGVLFTTAYATAPVCEPSLRSLLTGTPPFTRASVSRFPATDPRPGELLPGLLGNRGYASFQAGKLWLPDYRRAGFTEGTKQEPLEGDAMVQWMGGRKGLAVGRTTMEPVFRFIDRHETTPFFIVFAPLLPHRPWDAPPQVRARYAAAAPALGKATLAYYANISWLDDGVGQLVDYIDRKNLRSRTLIVYFSDNGFRQEPRDTFSPDTLDYAKGSMSELGFRTPVIFNWPGHLPAGAVRNDLVSLLDVFPTLLDFAGAPMPAGRSGLSLRAALERGAPVPRTEIIGSTQQVRPIAADHVPKPVTGRAYFLRSAKWHYAQYPDLGTEQLFAVESDPREEHDLADTQRAVVEELRARVERWKTEVPADGG